MTNDGHVCGEGQCELCQRYVKRLTEHHLRPRSQHKRLRKKGLRDMDFLNAKAMLCRACHSQIHALFTEKELALHYDMLEKLLEHPDVQKWANWVKDRPDRHIKVQLSNKKGTI